VVSNPYWCKVKSMKVDGNGRWACPRGSMRARTSSLRALSSVVFALLSTLTVVGCGHKEPPATATTVIMPGGRPADHFQGRSPRLRVAREEIGALLGHGLEIRIDQAFEPRWSSAGDEHIERIVVELGRTLKSVQVQWPKRFDAYKDKLRIVQYEFDATAPNTDTVFDPD